MNYISYLDPPQTFLKEGGGKGGKRGRRCREDKGKGGEVWQDQSKKNYKIKVETMQIYKTNAFLRSFKIV